MQENINLKTQLNKMQTEKMNTKREITNLENKNILNMIPFLELILFVILIKEL